MPPPLTKGVNYSTAPYSDAHYDLGPLPPPPLYPSTVPVYIVLTLRPALAVPPDYTRGTAVLSTHLHRGPAIRVAHAFMTGRGVREGDLQVFETEAGAGAEAGQYGFRSRGVGWEGRVRAWVERAEVDLEGGGVVGEWDGEGWRESGRVLGEVE